MADIVNTKFRIVEIYEAHTVPASVALPETSVCRFDTAGKAALADHDAPLRDVVGLAASTVTMVNQAVMVLKKALVYMDGIQSLAFGAKVWLSVTPGKMADADPGAGSIVLGTIVPLWDNTTAPTRLLSIDL